MENELQQVLDKIKQNKDTNLLPENLKAGVTCLGVEGKIEALDTTSNNPATETDIIQGKEAWVNGEKVGGTLDLTNLLPENIKAGVVINGIEGTYTGDEV